MPYELRIKKRPVFLSLFKIRLPVTGVLSIAHRISGVLMALAIPVLICLFALSLESAEGFAQAKAFFTHPIVMLLSIVLIWSLAHHLFAGIRFLLIDIDLGVYKGIARKTAWLVHGLAITTTIVIAAGVWL